MKKEKGKDMAASRYDGRESLLWIFRRAQSEAGTSGRVQSGHDLSELGHVGKGGGEGRG